MYACRYLGKGTSLKGMVKRASMDTSEVRLHAGGAHHLQKTCMFIKINVFSNIQGAGIVQ